MKKRVLSLLLASAAAACLVCGCGGNNNGIIILDDGGKSTLSTAMTVYGHKTDTYSCGVIEDVLQSFMSENSKVNVSYEGAAKADYWQALDRREKSGNLDDVFMTDCERQISMTAEGKIINLSDIVNEDIFDEIALSQLYGYDGGVYAVPTSVSTYGLYINYGLLEQHGQQVPRNLSEFTAVCDYFVNNGVTPVVCNGASSLRSLILALGMYQTYCTADTAEEIKKFNENPSNLAQPLNTGINFVYGMIESGRIDLSASSGGMQLFASGERPFMIADGQSSAALKEMLAADGKNLSYGVHAYPVLNSGSVLVAQADSFISVKKGANEDSAKEIAAYLTRPETLYRLNYGQSCFSPLKQTPFNSDSSIIPSASYLTKGKYVLGSDVNLKIPLSSILSECSAMILDGNGAETVKARLTYLLGEVGR